MLSPATTPEPTRDVEDVLCRSDAFTSCVGTSCWTIAFNSNQYIPILCGKWSSHQHIVQLVWMRSISQRGKMAVNMPKVRRITLKRPLHSKKVTISFLQWTNEPSDKRNSFFQRRCKGNPHAKRDHLTPPVTATGTILEGVSRICSWPTEKATEKAINLQLTRYS